MKQLRQGDILLVAVDKLPPKNIEARDRVVLAIGEATGHNHVLTGQVLDWTENDKRFIRIIGQAFGELFHEDHDPVPVAVVEPEVTYRVILQKETDLSGQWRRVQD